MNGLEEAILQKIKTAANGKPRFLAAIDGRRASGKSTLAAFLRISIPCAVVSMDDFSLRPEQRTQMRLQKAGGNVDYERFFREVLRPFKAGKRVSYRPFNGQSFDAPVIVEDMPVTIVEGVYACHPALRDDYDLRIFLSVDPNEQILRIRYQSGEAAAADFGRKWMPMEDRYIDQCHVRESCDAVYTSQPMMKKVHDHYDLA